MRQRIWFELWATESYSIRQLCSISGYSASTLKRIKSYWLSQPPPEDSDYARAAYVVYDATYFHKDGCLLNLMDAVSGKIIAHHYVRSESFAETFPWFMRLKQLGLKPNYVTIDGHRSVTRALRLVWPGVTIQRCLYHIQHEGMRWLRTYPKTQAGEDLRRLLSNLSSVKSPQERDSFVKAYQAWLSRYGDFVRSLGRKSIAAKDLNKTMTLVSCALPDMFRFIDEPLIHPTTNSLEGFHSRLKAAYWNHRGLSKTNRLKYLDWYCYLKNG